VAGYGLIEVRLDGDGESMTLVMSRILRGSGTERYDGAQVGETVPVLAKNVLSKVLSVCTDDLLVIKS
jgi:hypothetical protein